MMMTSVTNELGGLRKEDLPRLSERKNLLQKKKNLRWRGS